MTAKAKPQRLASADIQQDRMAVPPDFEARLRRDLEQRRALLEGELAAIRQMLRALKGRHAQ